MHLMFMENIVFDILRFSHPGDSFDLLFFAVNNVYTFAADILPL